MSEYMWGVTREKLSVRECLRRDKIAQSIDNTAGFIFGVFPGEGWKGWFFKRNEGHPFDQRVAEEINAAISKPVKKSQKFRFNVKFKDLGIDRVFEFDHTELPAGHGLEPGPWVKISARKYRKATTPFSGNVEEQLEHQQWAGLGLTCQVGSINVKVIPQ